ncbi:MAG: DUF4173 domain-containing protein [Alphaproteobacteria bacterium]|nr:DUF4173 domain-containing protein [Alphaproteobacteria bacterium]
MTEIATPADAAGGDGPQRTDVGARAFPPPTLAHFGLAAALVGLGDFALFDVTPGAAAGLFSAALIISMAILNPDLLEWRAGISIFVALLIGCAAIIEEPSFLTLGSGIAGLAAFAVGTEPCAAAVNAAVWLQRAVAYLLHGCFRLPIDILTMPRWASGQRWSKAVVAAGWIWFVPLTLSVIFLALFSAANPVLSSWLALIGDVDLHLPSAARLGFWIVLATIVWGALRGSPGSGEASSQTAATPNLGDFELVTNAIRKGLLSPAAVCRSLLLFNAVFAVQNGLDLRYLWGEEALPEGVTYAAYAHAGTYPLAVSALLAAGFVLLAFPSRLRGRGSRTAAALMYLWMTQSVFLVASAIARMGLYIEAYALTHQRILGLIVMALIAAGLILVALRIAFSKSNVWLINANALVLIGTLYVAGFVDFNRIIADHNVANCREMGGNGVPLDAPYLQSLGPSALPAARRYLSSPETLGSPKAWLVRSTAGNLEIELQARQSDWRSWTYRGYRLQGQKQAH